MTQKANDSFGRFLTHLPRSDDLTLIVLKGHLLVEEEINEILRMRLAEPKAIFDARLSFSQRIAVLKALSGRDSEEIFRFAAIEALNSLRNQLAHNLEPKDIEKRVAAFLREFEDPERGEEYSQESISRRLKRCVAFLCGMLAGWQRPVKSLQIKSQ